MGWTTIFGGSSLKKTEKGIPHYFNGILLFYLKFGVAINKNILESWVCSTSFFGLLLKKKNIH